MGCIYSDLDGTCILYDPMIRSLGTDEQGYCACEHKPAPWRHCNAYQSDYVSGGNNQGA